MGSGRDRERGLEGAGKVMSLMTPGTGQGGKRDVAVREEACAGGGSETWVEFPSQEREV